MLSPNFTITQALYVQSLPPEKAMIQSDTNAQQGFNRILWVVIVSFQSQKHARFGKLEMYCWPHIHITRSSSQARVVDVWMHELYDIYLTDGVQKIKVITFGKYVQHKRMIFCLNESLRMKHRILDNWMDIIIVCRNAFQDLTKALGKMSIWKKWYSGYC